MRLGRRPRRRAAGRGAPGTRARRLLPDACTARKARTAPCSGCSICWASRTRARPRSIARSRSTRSWRRTRWCGPASPTPEWVVVEGWALRDLGAGAALSQVTDRVGLPCVVKPSRSGSALGVSFVERARTWPPAVMAALSFAGPRSWKRRSRVRRWPSGSSARRRCEALPLVEIVPKSGVFDYAARYTAGATEYFAPARARSERRRRLTEPALPMRRRRSAPARRRAGRRDRRRGGKPWVLEVNVSPGMTDTSLLPMAAQAAGWSLAELCERILAPRPRDDSRAPFRRCHPAAGGLHAWNHDDAYRHIGVGTSASGPRNGRRAAVRRLVHAGRRGPGRHQAAARPAARR